MEVKPDKKVAEKAASAKEQKLLVHNLPSGTRWQPLKDFFRPFGTITRSDVSKSSDGEAVTGFITFADPTEAQNAIASLNGTMFDGNEIEVVIDDGSAVANSSSGVRVYVGNVRYFY
jgi:RNA recognition motif-containing protein